MDQPTEVLHNASVTLRRWREGDAEAVYQVVTSSIEHLALWMEWAADGYHPQDAAKFITQSQANWRFGEAFNYAIIAADGAVVGSCGLMARIGPGGLEIGYWLHPDYVGRGIATLAAGMLTSEAFRIGADYVEIVHDTANVRSAGIPKRLGFTEIKRRPQILVNSSEADGVVIVWRRDRR